MVLPADTEREIEIPDRTASRAAQLPGALAMWPEASTSGDEGVLGGFDAIR